MALHLIPYNGYNGVDECDRQTYRRTDRPRWVVYSFAASCIIFLIVNMYALHVMPFGVIND